MKLARQEDIALLFMAELAASYGTGLVPVSKIAKEHGISALVLKKIVRKLKAAGLVTAKEGLAGGYRLNVHPRRISLLSVTDAFSGKDRKDANIGRLAANCPLTPMCLPQSIRRTVTAAVEDSLSRIYLTDIVSGRVS